MVVFVDLEHDAFNKRSFSRGPDSSFYPYVEPGKPSLSKLGGAGSDPASGPAEVETDDPSADPARDSYQSQSAPEKPTLNRNSFSAALSCYPVIKEIARLVDLNTLDSLSQTCRQFHANLLPYRQQLVKQTLRCENEYVETLVDLLKSGTVIPDSVKSVIRLLSQGAMSSGRLTTGKISKCARDMVAECRRCSTVVCRNCTAKPATLSMLKNRIRRLCTTCRTAPLSDHLVSPSAPRRHSPRASPSLDESSFTTPAFLRTPCTCADAFWICHHCGMRLRSSDTTYRRVWNWRTRYSTYLGGLGTGIGEGCQGVKCGRGEDCLAAQEIEMEVECEADESSGSPHGHSPGLGNGPWGSHNHSNDRLESREEEEPGYFRQEIIGIGGRVKQKSKKRVIVGACVVEHEDERDSGRYLVREEEGQDRSWCGWCWRVIPSKSEL
ncbi:hypothetical protein P170DRAFT_508474 [Aspergillus steynii IBT 23096]|uniref:Uncharacterized protein n=1 Tax=Aspergillus steynii IBT 23096 TaxID=1392250 RepID=A0A2I2GBL2_9EURO|nr:uncharacterized protein P170DRAFT_508474 [Aspergillus steynii IBT 23096]PLB50270.1 hypothetical protein P170DRAFT_508474 [Aspergillus steynii IBT 23096]